MRGVWPTHLEAKKFSQEWKQAAPYFSQEKQPETMNYNYLNLFN